MALPVAHTCSRAKHCSGQGCFSLAANAITLLLEQIGFREPAGRSAYMPLRALYCLGGFDPHSGQDDLATAPTAMIEFASNLKPAEVADLPHVRQGASHEFIEASLKTCGINLQGCLREAFSPSSDGEEARAEVQGDIG